MTALKNYVCKVRDEVEDWRREYNNAKFEGNKKDEQFFLGKFHASRDILHKLESISGIDGMDIPNLVNDKTLVAIVDELKYRLRCGGWTAKKERFNQLLNQFISEFKLDSDPHMFATLPEE